MSIREQVEDARYLLKNERYVGALTTMMLAVAASAKKTFPKGTKSRKNHPDIHKGGKCEKCGRGPSAEMGDAEAFTLFLGGRIRTLLFNALGDVEPANSGVQVVFRDRPHDLAYVLYKYYRCELVHQGELPEDVEFAPPQPGVGMVFGNRDLSVGIGCGDKMVLDYGWIQVLIDAVEGAKCNGAIFGVQHHELVPNEGIDNATFPQEIAEKYNASIGRFETFKEVVRSYSDEVILQANDDELIALFKEQIDSGEVHLLAMSHKGLTDNAGRLLAPGLGMLREIASAYKRVKVELGQ